MDGHSALIDAALDTCRRAQFEFNDKLRRAQGRVFGLFGLDPSECAHQITSSGPFWRLREYAGEGTQRLIIVAAPIKRPYIWDLAPPISAIRNCIQQGLKVWLLEWLPASAATSNNGIAEYTAAISECVAQISDGRSAARPFVIGHSLGGTLAAIYGATQSDAIRGLLLLSAPLCFQPATSHFRDALVSLVPKDMSDTEPCPGSLLSHMSALASPHTFLWSRLSDAALSLTNGHSLEIHARVERWALDEVPLPGKLVSQLIEWLYRDNRFCQGNVTIAGKRIGPRNISVPTLAVANTADDVAPPDSVTPFIDTLRTRDARVIRYPGEIGVCLQHLGILIGRDAHTRVWPEIFEWIEAHH
jgi:polyhydroxyalkanoate synthase